MNPLRRKLAWFVVSSVAVAMVPVLSTHPAGAVAVKVIQAVVEGRQQPAPKPDIKQAVLNETPLYADPACAKTYDDGVRFAGARVEAPCCAVRQARSDGWWDRGPVRRGVRGVGRGFKGAFCFLTRPFRRC